MELEEDMGRSEVRRVAKRNETARERENRTQKWMNRSNLMLITRQDENRNRVT